MRVRLTSEADGAVALESPYNADFVDALKLRIDYGGRKWDAGRKRWIVSALYADTLVQFLLDIGCDIRDDRDPPAHQNGSTALTAVPPMPAELKESFDTLFLAYAAPLCVAEASYKALSRYHHPDKGGKTEDFHGINDAIEVIRRYLDPRPDDVLPF